MLDIRWNTVATDIHKYVNTPNRSSVIDINIDINNIDINNIDINNIDINNIDINNIEVVVGVIKRCFNCGTPCF